MEIRRRRAIQLVAAGAGIGAVAVASVSAQATSSVQTAPRTPPDTARERPERPTRYLFTATLYDSRDLPELTSLEELWADSRYLQVQSCRVRYVGSRPQILTAEENAAVDAAVAAGARGTREQICLDIVTAATRLDQRTIEAGVRRVGAPIVQGVLVLAPQAPQAAIMRRWVDAGAPV